MITWFQNTFGKHYKWALIAVLVIMLVSTIVGIGAVPRGALTARQSTQRMYLGIDLNDQQATQDLVNAVQFTNQSLSDNPVSSQPELQLLMDERLALLQLANEWKIPEATSKQVDAYLKSLSVFQDADGNFSPVAYSAFHDSIQAAEPAKRDLAVATIKENCRLERVRQILGGPGYALPFLAQATAGLNKLQLNLDAATIDFTKFEATVPDVKDDVLKAIFDKNPDRFQKAAVAHLSYAKFVSAPVGEPTATQIHDYAVAHKDTLAVQPDKLSDKDKTAVTDAWRTEQKSQVEKDAGDAALKFARELFDLKLARNSPEFAALLKKYNLTLQSLPALEQGKPAPSSSPISDDILQQVAFNELNAQQPFSSPVPATDGVAILFLDQAEPSRAQTFEEAKADVKAVYAQQEKINQFLQHGQVVQGAIVKAMGEGKTFAEAAAAQGLTVKNYPEVSYEGIRDTVMSMSLDATQKSTTGGPLASMGRDLLMALASPTANQGPPLMMTLKPNDVSPLVPTNSLGAIFHVVNRTVPPVAADSVEVKRANQTFKSDESNRGAMLYLQRVIQNARDSLKQAEASQG